MSFYEQHLKKVESVQQWMDSSKKRTTVFQALSIITISAFALPTFGASLTIPVAIGSVIANTWSIYGIIITLIFF